MGVGCRPPLPPASSPCLASRQEDGECWCHQLPEGWALLRPSRGDGRLLAGAAAVSWERGRARPAGLKFDGGQTRGAGLREVVT